MISDQVKAKYQGSVRPTVKNIYNKPPAPKTTAPTISRFQEIIKTAIKTKTGILCMNKPTTICHQLDAESKTSSENNAKNAIKHIDKIRGVQKRSLLLIFAIIILQIDKIRFPVGKKQIPAEILPQRRAD
jgi:hypothetical protein